MKGNDALSTRQAMYMLGLKSYQEHISQITQWKSLPEKLQLSHLVCIIKEYQFFSPCP